MSRRFLAISLVTEIVLVLSSMLLFKDLSAILAEEDIGWNILRGWSWLTSLAASFFIFFVGPKLVGKTQKLVIASSHEEALDEKEQSVLINITFTAIALGGIVCNLPHIFPSLSLDRDVSEFAGVSIMGLGVLVSMNADGFMFRHNDFGFDDTENTHRDRNAFHSLFYALSVFVGFSFLTGIFILVLALICHGVEIKNASLRLLISAFIIGILMGLLLLRSVTKDASLDESIYQRKDFSSFAVKLVASTIVFCLPLGIELLVSAGYSSIEQVAVPAGAIFLMSIVYLLLVGVMWEFIEPYSILRDSIRSSAIAIAIMNNIALGALILGLSTLFARMLVSFFA